MSSVALERLILVSTNNHVYSFKGINRVQKSGMPTGLSETGYLADLFMLWWDKKFIELLESVSLSCDLCVRFKDDGNIIMDKITNVPEEVWNIIDRNKLKFDIENPNFTANLIFELANKVHDMIDFTFDTPHMNADGKLPILDVKVHLTPKNTLVHEFYEKPTRNLKVILAESALSWSQKRTVHTQEILRRMKNTSQSLEKSTKDDILSKYMYKMKLSGYRSECLLSAKNAFSLLVQKHEADGKPIFRNREELSQFKAMKNKTPSNWWKAPTNSRNQYTAVMFVPPTPGGNLPKG